MIFLRLKGKNQNQKRNLLKIQNLKKLSKKLKKKQIKKKKILKKNYLINSTRKYDDMGDWLYLKLVIENVGAITKAALGNYDEWDKLIDKMFYEYNDK